MLPAAETALRQGMAQLSANGQPPENALVDGFLGYLALLKKWNNAYALTAITDDAQMVTHHLLDCVAAFPHIAPPQVRTVLDVGSGGGMPGVPLAIAYPQLQVTVVDSNSKKTRFLEQAKIELKLPNLNVIHSRVEDLVGDSRAANGFDVITSRAFADLALFWQLAHPLLAENGFFAAMKGPKAEDEAHALPDHVAYDIRGVNVPGLDAQRSVALLRRK
jgi:16S rRNA (guanine527-N7)-methyltransferase